MIKYKIGDLIEAAKQSEINVLAHCANCYCTFGSGVAPQIKKAFPEAYAADCETVSGDMQKLGTFTKAFNNAYTEPLMIYNLYGQGGYGKRKTGGRDLDYDAIYNALDSMKNDLLVQKDVFPDYQISIGLPCLGAGLAGGDWDIIEKMIEKTLCSANFDVTVYIRKIEEAPKSQNLSITLLTTLAQQDSLY